MKKSIGKFLIGFSIAIMVVGPIYQTVDSYIYNNPQDGEEVWGDNPIFRNIIGVKTVYKYFESVNGWHRYRTDIETPAWMQALGLPKVVSFGQKDPDNWIDPDNEQSPLKFSTLCVISLRWCVKLVLPLLLFALGRRLSKTKTEIQPQD